MEKKDPQGVAVVDAALMIESGGYRRFDKLVVVHCGPKVQLERLISRDGLSRADAERRVAAQMSQEEKKRHADFLSYFRRFRKHVETDRGASFTN